MACGPQLVARSWPLIVTLGSPHGPRVAAGRASLARGIREGRHVVCGLRLVDYSLQLTKLRWFVARAEQSSLPLGESRGGGF